VLRETISKMPAMKLTTLSWCSFFTALASSPFGIPVNVETPFGLRVRRITVCN